MPESGKKKIQLDLKWVVMIVGFISTLGGFVSSYWKGQLDLQNRIWEVQVEAQTERDTHQRAIEVQMAALLGRIELLEANLKHRIDWQERAIEELAQAVPEAIRAHEGNMHPSKKATSSEGTDVQVTLPDKPMSIQMPLVPSEELLKLKKSAK